MLVDLVGEIELKEILLLFLLVHGCLDLVKGLLGAEMRLVVQAFYGLACLFALLLLLDLILQVCLVSQVLLLPVQRLDVFHVVHVVECRIKLAFLVLTGLLCCLNLLVKALESLFIDGAYLAVGVCALVSRVVVNGEGTLRPHKLRQSSVVVV